MSTERGGGEQRREQQEEMGRFSRPRLAACTRYVRQPRWRSSYFSSPATHHRQNLLRPLSSVCPSHMLRTVCISLVAPQYVAANPEAQPQANPDAEQTTTVMPRATCVASTLITSTFVTLSTHADDPQIPSRVLLKQTRSARAHAHARVLGAQREPARARNTHGRL